MRNRANIFASSILNTAKQKWKSYIYGGCIVVLLLTSTANNYHRAQCRPIYYNYSRNG